MPDITDHPLTDHPQFHAVSMMVKERMVQIADVLGCRNQLAETDQARLRGILAAEAMTAVLLRAYDRAHSADKAAP